MATIELITTGVLMGIIDVVTGPDHLAALATLTGADIKSPSHQRSSGFFLGIKWGLGHSLGIIVAGSTLIALDASSGKEVMNSSDWIDMDDTVHAILEGIVGVFMLALGSYGIHRAFANRTGVVPALRTSMTSLKPKESDDEERGGGLPGDISPHSSRLDRSEATERTATATNVPPENRRGTVEILSEMSEVLNRDGDSIRRMSDGQVDDELDDVEQRIFNAVESLRRNSDSDSIDCDQILSSLKAAPTTATDLSNSFIKILTKKPTAVPASRLVKKHAAPENSIVLDPPDGKSRYRLGKLYFLCTPSVWAILAGVVQGAAGPGGVLGVVPAVQLRDPLFASIYLGTFCVTSTLAMACLASFYSTFSKWMASGQKKEGRREGSSRSRAAGSGGSGAFVVEVGSALLSIGVGIVWLILLSVGKLNGVFI